MRPEALFGLSVLLSLAAYALVARIYVWPRLQRVSREDALIALVIPHTFRFVGLSFLISGVVSPSLPAAFAIPAGYGDLGATLLAFAAIGALSARSTVTTLVLWLFNLWGAIDLLTALYQGEIGVQIAPGMLGAAYFIPTVLVPGWVVSHAIVFWMLLRPRHAGAF